MPFRLTPVVLNLLIVNGLVFLVMNIFTGRPWYPQMVEFFLLCKADIGLFDRIYECFQPVQVLTHFFTHIDFGHILMNMLGLVFLGVPIEQTMGSRRFFIFYMVTGLVAGVLIALFDPSPGPVLGASGAISGILVAFAFYYPNQKLSFIFFPFIGFRSIHLVIGLAAISLFFIVQNLLTPGAGGGISHFGHFMGMLVAFVYLFWPRIRKLVTGER